MSSLILSLFFPMAYAYSAAEEYEIKAAFLYNLGSYLRFPSSRLSDDDTSQPFHICILGRDPFQQNIDTAAENEQIQGHPTVIKRLQRVQDAGNCHILFISDSERSRFKAILQALHQLPILTVGDTDDFIDQGGMLKFYSDNNKIRLALDLGKIRAADIKPSANLLKIVKIVGDVKF
ncbi:MAG: YfiR family protein [Thiotrichaceae bacterium]